MNHLNSSEVSASDINLLNMFDAFCDAHPEALQAPVALVTKNKAAPHASEFLTAPLEPNTTTERDYYRPILVQHSIRDYIITGYVPHQYRGVSYRNMALALMAMAEIKAMSF